MGDIGQHFPDNDPTYKNIDSKILLRKVNDIIESKGFRVNNIDSTIVMERPKLRDYIIPIRKSIAEILNIHFDLVSVKATTSEKLGFVGSEKGVKAFANVLIVEDLGD